MTEKARPTEQEEADLIAKLATGEVKPADLELPVEHSQLETLLSDELAPPPGATIH